MFKKMAKLSIGIALLALPQISSAVEADGVNEPQSDVCIQDTLEQDPYLFFKLEYGDMTILPLDRVRSPSSDVKSDILGKKIAIYFVDAENLNQPVIVEGVLKNISLQSVSDWSSRSAYYIYEVSLADQSLYSVASDSITEVRVALPAHVPVDKFNHLYEKWQALTSSQINCLNLQKMTGAFLVKNSLSIAHITEGVIRSIASKYYGGESWSIYYVAKADGTVEEIHSDNILALRIKPLGIRIVK